MDKRDKSKLDQDAVLAVEILACAEMYAHVDQLFSK